ncbi:MAG: hypothetical protein ABI303_00425 [Candidatus Saccharimonas sp.]
MSKSQSPDEHQSPNIPGPDARKTTFIPDAEHVTIGVTLMSVGTSPSSRRYR